MSERSRASLVATCTLAISAGVAGQTPRLPSRTPARIVVGPNMLVSENEKGETAAAQSQWSVNAQGEPRPHEPDNKEIDR